MGIQRPRCVSIAQEAGRLATNSKWRGEPSRNATRKRAISGERTRTSPALDSFAEMTGMRFAGDPWSNEGRLRPSCDALYAMHCALRVCRHSSNFVIVGTDGDGGGITERPDLEGPARAGIFFPAK